MLERLGQLRIPIDERDRMSNSAKWSDTALHLGAMIQSMAEQSQQLDAIGKLHTKVPWSLHQETFRAPAFLTVSSNYGK